MKYYLAVGIIIIIIAIVTAALTGWTHNKLLCWGWINVLT